MFFFLTGSFDSLSSFSLHCGSNSCIHTFLLLPCFTCNHFLLRRWPLLCQPVTLNLKRFPSINFIILITQQSILNHLLWVNY